MDRTKLKNIVLIIAGSASVGIGAVGLVVPVLPTTPFLLLACFCYLRSSQRLHDWLLGHRVFGKYIYNYITYKAMTRKTKISSLVFLWTGLSLSIYLVPNLHVRLLLLAVGVGVTAHLLLLKTI